MASTGKVIALIQALQGAGVSPDEIKAAVAEWLAEHVDPDTGYVIDDTFSIPGAAPDAKLTGDELNDLKSAITNLDDDIYGTGISPVAQTNGYYTKSDGKIAFTANSGSRAFIADLSAYVGKRVHVRFAPQSGSSRLTAMCDDSSPAVVNESYIEANMTAQGWFFDITATYNQLYISYTYSASKNLDVRIVDGKLSEGDFPYSPVYEQGGLDTTDGSETESSTAIRSEFIPLNGVTKIAFAPASGYTYRVFWFKKDMSLYQPSSSYEPTARTSAASFTDYLEAKYIRVVLAKSNSSAVTVMDAIKLTITETSFDTADSVYDEMNVSSIDFSLELGSIYYVTGDEQNSTTRVRTGFIRVGVGTVISSPVATSSYLPLWVARYDEARNYIGNNDWAKQEICNFDGYVRILFRKENNATISASEVDSLKKYIVIRRELPQGLIDDVAQADYEQKATEVPSYFKTNLESAIATARMNMCLCGIDGLSFVFITDPHWATNAQHSPVLIKNAVDALGLKTVICGGDILTSQDKGKAKASMISFMQAMNIPGVDFYTMYGNHDKNEYSSSTAYYFTTEETYALMQQEFVFEPVKYGEYFYFYRDYANNKIRAIFLDTGMAANAVDQDQQDWLEDVLSETPSGYRIIIFQHISYQTVGEDAPFIPPQCEEFFDTFDEFNSNNADKEIVAIISGHAHYDDNANATTGGIPIIMCDTDGLTTESESGATTGTINEQCVSIFTVDCKNRKIKYARIGRGSDLSGVNFRTVT